MKLKFFTSIFIFLLFAISPLSSQIDLDRIAKEAQRNVNKRVEKNIDKSIDNAMDNAEDSVKKKKRKKNKKGEEEYEPEVEIRTIKEVLPNEFLGEFTINRSFEGNGSESTNMIMVVMDEYRTAVRPLILKKPHNLIIYDKQDETVVTINNNDFEGMAMKDWFTSQTSDNDDFSTASKSSDIKEIEGYIARRYEVEHDEYSAEIWFTKEIDADVSTIYDVMQYAPLFLDKSLGFPLEMTIQHKDDSIERVQVKNIVENSGNDSLIDISEYELIDMTDLKHGK